MDSIETISASNQKTLTLEQQLPLEKRQNQFNKTQKVTLAPQKSAHKSTREDSLFDGHQKENDDKFTYYYGSYNHNVHYKPYMEFDIKDMRRIVNEQGEFTNYITKKSEWERVTDFVLNSDKTRFEFYLTLMNLGLINKTSGAMTKKNRKMRTFFNKFKLSSKSTMFDDPTKFSKEQMDLIINKVKSTSLDSKREKKEKKENPKQNCLMSPEPSMLTRVTKKSISFKQSQTNFRFKNRSIDKIFKKGITMQGSPKGKSISSISPKYFKPEGITNNVSVPPKIKISNSVLGNKKHSIYSQDLHDHLGDKKNFSALTMRKPAIFPSTSTNQDFKIRLSKAESHKNPSYFMNKRRSAHTSLKFRKPLQNRPNRLSIPKIAETSKGLVRTTATPCLSTSPKRMFKQTQKPSQSFILCSSPLGSTKTGSFKNIQEEKSQNASIEKINPNKEIKWAFKKNSIPLDTNLAVQLYKQRFQKYHKEPRREKAKKNFIIAKAKQFI
ncbi:unnamed protein product [Moneuplotes crassus]|uniref:Uncharacterized protein n=1 Tax=Euplotes crassus TaxID=5936 RepID=A0AAD1U0S0_EUPCR|nr:unnamed protein product [Moneuplotes crassus]